MIFPMQIQAARALLGLTQQDLAKRSSVGLGTVKRIEAARDQLIGTVKTISQIQEALEAAGIEFLGQDEHHGPGVRMRRPLRGSAKRK